MLWLLIKNMSWVLIRSASWRASNKFLQHVLTFDIITPKTMGVLLIWYITHIESLKVLSRKVFQLSQHKESVDRQTDGWTDISKMTHIWI